MPVLSDCKPLNALWTCFGSCMLDGVSFTAVAFGNPDACTRMQGDAWYYTRAADHFDVDATHAPGSGSARPEAEPEAIVLRCCLSGAE